MSVTPTISRLLSELQQLSAHFVLDPHCIVREEAPRVRSEREGDSHRLESRARLRAVWQEAKTGRPMRRVSKQRCRTTHVARKRIQLAPCVHARTSRTLWAGTWRNANAGVCNGSKESRPFSPTRKRRFAPTSPKRARAQQLKRLQMRASGGPAPNGFAPRTGQVQGRRL